MGRAFFLGTVVALVVLGMACATTEPTATPASPAMPEQPVAPTVMAEPTATLVPGAPTPIPARPTPTRVLPTPTAVMSMAGPVYGGTLIMGGDLAIDSLDPAYNTLFGGLAPMHNMYEGLFRIDATGNIVEALAESWDFSDDGRVITARLRPGSTFHDGTPADANAVKWNFDRMMDPNQFSPQRADLEQRLQSVEAVDSSTVRLTLLEAFRPFVAQLASERMGMTVSPAAVRQHGGGREGDYGRNPVGSGPFRFSEWTLRQRVVLERNPDYWNSERPYLDRIVMLDVPDTTVRIAMLRTGEASFSTYTGLTGAHLPTLEASPGLRVIRQDGAGNAFFQFNTSLEPFDNTALRQAFAYAVNRDDLITGAWGGLGTPGYTMNVRGWAYNPDLKPVEYNPEMAKQKLAEAGFPDGVTIPIGCITAGFGAEVCEVAQAIVSQVGIDLDIQLILPSIFFSRQEGFMNSPGFGNRGWASRVDPHTLLQFMAHSEGFHNLGSYVNPQVDGLIAQAAAEYELVRAKPLYEQIETIISEKAAFLFYLRRTNLWVAADEVQGFEPFIPPVFEYFANTWIEQ